MLSARFHRGATLPDAVLEEVVDLRGEVGRLRPETRPDDDRRSMTACLRGSSTVCVLRDHEDVAQGVWSTHDQLVTVDGHRRLLIYTDQVWLRRAHRGDPGLPLSCLRHGLALVARHRCHRVYVGGTANPLSYNALQGWFGTLHALADADLPAVDRMLLESVAVSLGPRWDPATRRARLRVLPPPIADHVRARPGAAERIAHFEMLNPDWAEGWGLPIVGRVPWRKVLLMPVRSARRARRRSARR
jgi:hypothetical protein